jgi:hypothetical protein
MLRTRLRFARSTSSTAYFFLLFQAWVRSNFVENCSNFVEKSFGNLWLTIQNTTNRHVSNAFGLLAVFISFPLARAPVAAAVAADFCCCCCWAPPFRDDVLCQ